MNICTRKNKERPSGFFYYQIGNSIKLYYRVSPMDIPKAINPKIALEH